MAKKRSYVRKTRILTYDQLPPKAKAEYDAPAYESSLFFKAYGQYWAMADGMKNHPSDKTCTVWSGHFGVCFAPYGDEHIQYYIRDVSNIQ